MVRRKTKKKASERKCTKYVPDGIYEVVVKKENGEVTHTYRFGTFAEAKKEAIALKTYFPERIVTIYKCLGRIKCK